MDKPEYMIVNEESGFVMYRKLFPGEEVWYESEIHRLRKLGDALWLRLQECRYGETMKNIKQNYVKK